MKAVVVAQCTHKNVTSTKYKCNKSGITTQKAICKRSLGVWVTIALHAGGGAQFHVDFNEAPFPARKVFMAMVTFKAKLKRPKMIPEKPKVVQNCSKGIRTARVAWASHCFFENSVRSFFGTVHLLYQNSSSAPVSKLRPPIIS